MSKPLSDTITVVERAFEAAKNAVPDWDPHDYSRDFFAKQREAMSSLAAHLEQTVGANISVRYDGARCRIAGIASSSTTGIQGAVQNWLVAARKRAA